MAGPTRLELATSCVTGRRSNRTELRPREWMLKNAHLRRQDLKFELQRTTQYASAQISSPSLHLGICEHPLFNLCCNISYGRRNRYRTCDLGLVRAALYQLSYPPPLLWPPS